MIFTTIDTYLLTTLQIGLLGGSRVFRRHNLSGIVLASVALSVLIPNSLITPIGVLVPSLMGLPLLSVCKGLFPRKFRWLPPPERFLPLSALMAVSLFAVSYRELPIDSSWHLNIPVYMLGAAVLSAAVLNVVRFKEKRIG